MVSTEKIIKDFEYMFKTSDREPVYYYSIEFNEGWNDLLYEMCSKIAKIDKKKLFRFSQIKEKFGLARIYHNNINRKIDKLVYSYENKSGKICEICGEKGKMRSLNHWYFTNCDKHYNERLNGK